jgi:hypothetical protein
MNITPKIIEEELVEHPLQREILSSYGSDGYFSFNVEGQKTGWVFVIKKRKKKIEDEIYRGSDLKEALRVFSAH